MQPFKRKVFYIGGFDPRGLSHYHALFLEQMRRHAARTGIAVDVSAPRRGPTPHRGEWTARDAAGSTVVDYTFLQWEDIVRKGWIRNPLTLARRAVATYIRIVAQGDFSRARMLGRGQLITLFYPPITALLFPLLLALISGSVMALALASWLPWFLIGCVVGLSIAWPILRVLHSPWLLRFFIFNDDLARGAMPAVLQDRLRGFADAIADGMTGYDEVMLMTHSNGSILSILVLNDLLGRWGGKAPANFVFVTLGHCIPLVACRRDARHFRDALGCLGGGDFHWIDIGSPPDGAAYFGVNPLLLYHDQAMPRVELLSPRFHLFHDPATYRNGWTNKYEIHFDYLRSGDHPSPLDFPNLMLAPHAIEQSVATFRLIP